MHPGYLTIACRELLRDYLRSDATTAILDLPFVDEEIQVTPKGRPPAVMGDKFIGIYASSWEPALVDANVAIDAYLGVSCVLTFRSTVYPQEQLEELYADVTVGMSAVCLKIMQCLAQNTSLYTELAELTNYSTYWTFEFLRWMGTDAEPVEVYEDWFSAKDEHLLDPMGQSIMGYTMTVRFGQARAGLIPGV